MKSNLRLLLFGISLVSIIITIISCNKEGILDSRPPRSWVLMQDNISISDTLTGFRVDYNLDVPASGATYRLKSIFVLGIPNIIIDAPQDYNDYVTIVYDPTPLKLDGIVYYSYFDITFKPNNRKETRTILLHTTDDDKNLSSYLYIKVTQPSL